MSIDIRYDTETDSVAISGELTIYHIEEVRAEIIAHAKASLDLSDVEDIDGAGLQVLLAYCRDRQQSLKRVSEAVRDTLDLVGMSELIGAES